MSAKSNYLGLMNIFQFLLGMTNLYRKMREKYDILNQVDIRLRRWERQDCYILYMRNVHAKNLYSPHTP